MPSLRRSRRAAAVVRWLIGLAALSTLVVGLSWWFLRPLPYAVEAFIKLHPHGSAFWNEDQQRDAYSLQSLRNNCIALLRSQNVIEMALGQQDIKVLDVVERRADTVNWVRDSLEIDAVADDILRVRLRAADAEQAQETAKLLNAVLNGFIKIVDMDSGAKHSAKLDALQNLILQTQEDLSQQLVALQEREASLAETSTEQQVELKISRLRVQAQEDVLLEYSKTLLREQALAQEAASVRVRQYAFVTEKPTP